MNLVYRISLALLFLSSRGIAQVQNNGNLRMHTNSKMVFHGNFTNNGTFNNNLGTLYVTGAAQQTFDGSNLIQTTNLILNKTTNPLQVTNEVQVSGLLTFSSGIIQSERMNMATEFVHFLDGATYSGSSDASHIDGVVRKTGNDAFVFPIGNNGFLRTTSISAPSNISDHFTNYYNNTDPHSSYDRTALDAGLDHVSACEYWVLERTGGNSNVEVNLSWASNSCGVDNLCDLRIAQWNGTQWIDKGNGGTTGTSNEGTLVSGASCSTPSALSNFGVFSLASATANNALPIELLTFNAQRCDDEVCLFWQTATEINNDFFTVERSVDAISFEAIGRIDGAGTSSYLLDYNSVDVNPYQGVNYYRLKQTDFDGSSSYSLIRAVEFSGLQNTEITVFPNPTTDYISIKASIDELTEYRIFSLLGQDVTSLVPVLNQNGFVLQLDLSALTTGVYTLTTKTSAHKIQKI